MDISSIPSTKLSGTGVFAAPFTYNGKGDASENPVRYRPSDASDVQPATPRALQKVPPGLAHNLSVDTKTQSVQQWAKQVPEVIPRGFPAVSSGSASRTLQSRLNGTDALSASQGTANSKFVRLVEIKKAKISRHTKDS